MIAAMLAIVLSAPASSPAAQDVTLERFDDARLAWDTGDFLKALDGFEAVLKSADGDRFFDRIALITGELYKTTEIAADGRTIRVSPDGRYAAFETGPRSAALTRVVSLENPGKSIADIPATGLVFSPSPNGAAYLRIKPTPEIADLRKEIARIAAQAAPDRTAQMAQQRRLTWLEAKAAEIVVIDLAAKKERDLQGRRLSQGRPGLEFGRARSVFRGGQGSRRGFERDLLGERERERSAPDFGPGIQDVARRRARRKILGLLGGADDAVPQAPAGRASAAAAARPALRRRSRRASRPPAGGARGGFGGGAARPFFVLNLADGTAKSFSGSSPALSADGSTLVFTAPDGPGLDDQPAQARRRPRSNCHQEIRGADRLGRSLPRRSERSSSTHPTPATRRSSSSGAMEKGRSGSAARSSPTARRVF